MARCLLVMVAGLFVTAAVWAEPAIDVGNLYAAPGQAQAWNRLFVTGGDDVQGMELNVKLTAGAGDPFIDSMDIFTGTIFESNNDGLFPGSYVNNFEAYQGVVTSSGTVSADGLITTIIFDASSATAGNTYDFSLTNIEGPTNFTVVSASLTDGQLVVTNPGDTNGDFYVDIQDLTALASNWSALSAGEKLWNQGNFNPGDSGVDPSKDWLVDIQDLTALANNWTGAAPGGEVPEPATLAMLGMGAAVLLRRRR